MKKALFIYNPVAGRGQIRAAVSDLMVQFSRSGYLLTVFPTAEHGDAARIAAELSAEHDCVICAGGDGTLDEVVSGMEESPAGQRPVIYLPAGSTNDFGASLGISFDVRRAALQGISGTVRAVDLGCFGEDRYFVYVAAFGLFTGVSYDTSQVQKNMFGRLAYLFNGLLELGYVRTYHVRVESPDVTLEGDFAYGMVTNSMSVGGFAGITGDGVDLSDGLFEVTLIRLPENAAELARLIAALNDGSLRDDMITHFKTDRLTVSSGEEISWTLDGEFGGAYRRVEMHNRRHGLQIVTADEDAPQIEGEP